MTVIQSDLQRICVEGNGLGRTFAFRNHSQGDREVVDQMFYRRDYDLSSFHYSRSINLLYKDILNDGKIPFVVDAGANIGASVVFFALEFPGCQIIAIEPESNNCALLRQNCEGLNYKLIEGGVGCENGAAFLTDTGRGDLAFTLSEKGSYPVRVHSLTDIIHEQIALGGVPLIIKIDIEGSEAELFRASTNWLTLVPLLIVELHDWMLPGKGVSRNFLRAISNYNFDFVYQGENVFCFNNDALCEFGTE